MTDDHKTTIDIAQTRLALTLPTGTVFPDWSAVASGQAKAALDAIFDAIGVERCWAGLEDAEDRVRRSLLDYYGKNGRPPSVAQLAKLGKISAAEVSNQLAHLRDRDLVVLDDGGEISGAYPFTERDSGHRVRLGQTRLNAMCAIDALGAGAMYGQDSTIESGCAYCDEKISVTTGKQGKILITVAPETAVVWSGITYAEDCAADSLCRVISFFCSDAHLEAWRQKTDPDAKGFRLSVDEGLQAGRAIFQPLLAGEPAAV